MRILLALTYYRPHLSGLTLYVERLATALVARGHDVTVLASQHDPSLPPEAVEDGVRIVRVPVTFRVGKGPVMASHGRFATRLLRSHEVVSIHLPQLEAASLALQAWALRRPALLTYHCDLLLPPGLVNRAADRVVAGSNFAAAALATQIIAYTTDYAESVPLLRRFREKLEIVPPPVVMAQPDELGVEEFRRRHLLVRPDGTLRPVIGMAARLATEKGVDVLLSALPSLQRRFPDLHVLFAGPYVGIAGEEAYRARLAPAIEALGDSWSFLGPLDPAAEMPSFLAALDCLVVPSINSTESFGLVQVEAMLCGTPVVASALPGVREVVRTTAMGEIAAVGDAAALADGIRRVLEAPERYWRPRSEIETMFDLETTVERYEELFARSLRRAFRGGRTSPKRT